MDFNKFSETFYCRFLLSPTERIVLNLLTKKVLYKNNQYSDNGLMVVNMKLKTLAFEAGLNYYRLIDAIDNLDKLGIIIKLTKRPRNGRYFLGFFSRNGERQYLFNYLVSKFDTFIKQYIVNQLKKVRHKYYIPKIKDNSLYELDMDIREFITQFIDSPVILVSRPMRDGKTVTEVVFGSKDVYRPSLKSVEDPFSELTKCQL